MNDNQIALCGIYCGACPSYKRQSRPEPGLPVCKGCRYNDNHLSACYNCRFQNCVRSKNIDNCSECSDYPCSMLTAFRDDGKPHHSVITANLDKLKKTGIFQMLESEKTRWTCECGERFTWYETHCTACGKPVNSFGPDPSPGK